MSWKMNKCWVTKSCLRFNFNINVKTRTTTHLEETNTTLYVFLLYATIASHISHLRSVRPIYNSEFMYNIHFSNGIPMVRICLDISYLSIWLQPKNTFLPQMFNYFHFNLMLILFYNLPRIFSRSEEGFVLALYSNSLLADFFFHVVRCRYKLIYKENQMIYICPRNWQLMSRH